MPAPSEVVSRSIAAISVATVDLGALQDECGYSPYEDCSVDSLIEYKDALEGVVGQLEESLATRATALTVAVLEDLHAQLYPEQHPGYDPDHVFWISKTSDEAATFAARRKLEQELYAPVAELHRQRRHHEAEQLHLTLSPQLEALGDVDVFQWDSSTIEVLAARIEQLRTELSQ